MFCSFHDVCSISLIIITIFVLNTNFTVQLLELLSLRVFIFLYKFINTLTIFKTKISTLLFDQCFLFDLLPHLIRCYLCNDRKTNVRKIFPIKTFFFSGTLCFNPSTQKYFSKFIKMQRFGFGGPYILSKIFLKIKKFSKV